LNRKVKKLKYKIDWLRLELEEVREVNAKCLERFFQDFAEVLTEDIEEKVVETLPEKKSFHAAEHITNKLFKEIAVKTHPDKNKNNDEAFINANKANEVNNLSELLNIANKLGIETDKYIDDEIMLEQHSSELMTRIKQIQSQVAWIWYHAQEGDRVIMRQRIIQLLKTQ
jgi:hypothetical protein